MPRAKAGASGRAGAERTDQLRLATAQFEQRRHGSDIHNSPTDMVTMQAVSGMPLMVISESEKIAAIPPRPGKIARCGVRVRRLRRPARRADSRRGRGVDLPRVAQ